MRLKSIDFDDNGAVSNTYVFVENKEEMIYVTDMEAHWLTFPVTIRLTSDEVEDLFDKAGAVTGNLRESDTANEVYFTLGPVIDRFIRYGI